MLQLYTGKSWIIWLTIVSKACGRHIECRVTVEVIYIYEGGDGTAATVRHPLTAYSPAKGVYRYVNVIRSYNENTPSKYTASLDICTTIRITQFQDCKNKTVYL